MTVQRSVVSGIWLKWRRFWVPAASKLPSFARFGHQSCWICHSRMQIWVTRGSGLNWSVHEQTQSPQERLSHTLAPSYLRFQSGVRRKRKIKEEGCGSECFWKCLGVQSSSGFLWGAETKAEERWRWRSSLDTTKTTYKYTPPETEEWRAWRSANVRHECLAWMALFKFTLRPVTSPTFTITSSVMVLVRPSHLSSVSSCSRSSFSPLFI